MADQKDEYEEIIAPVTAAAREAAGALWQRIHAKGIYQGQTLAAELCRRRGFDEAAEAIIEDRDIPF